MKILRVFFVIHTRKSGTNNYSKVRTHQDFEDHDHIKAYDHLYNHYGRFAMNDRTNRAPDEWVEINSHTFIDPDREVVRLPEERVYEAPLFPAEFYKETLSRKPE